jgi:hypothetical protein
MNRILRVASLLILSLSAFPSPVAPGQGASSPSGPGSAGQPVTIEYYYKLVAGTAVPGGASEWLELYKKNHNPILKQLMKEGLILSEKAYERRFHAESPAWDYKVVMVWRDWAALQQASEREPEIIRSLYPDKAAHDREEKRRWELTERHWDDVLKGVPLD